MGVVLQGKGWREVQTTAPDTSCLDIKTTADSLMPLANDAETDKSPLSHLESEVTVFI